MLFLYYDDFSFSESKCRQLAIECFCYHDYRESIHQANPKDLRRTVRLREIGAPLYITVAATAHLQLQLLRRSSVYSQ